MADPLKCEYCCGKIKNKNKAYYIKSADIEGIISCVEGAFSPEDIKASEVMTYLVEYNAQRKREKPGKDWTVCPDCWTNSLRGSIGAKYPHYFNA